MTSSEKPVADELWDESLDGSPEPINPSAFFPKALRIFLVGSTVVWLLVAIEAFSDVALNLILLGFLFLTGLMLALAWMIGTLCWMAGRVTFRSRFEVAQWAFIPLAGLIGILLLKTDIDFEIRFRFSESALQDCVGDLSSANEVNYRDNGRRVGLFQFNSIWTRDGCVLMTCPGPFPEGGLIYCKSGRPPQWTSEYSFQHVRGPWWLYENNF